MAYSVAIPVECKTCQKAPTHKVFGSFNDTSFLDDYYCSDCAAKRVKELSIREKQPTSRVRHDDPQDACEWQREDVRELDAQEKLGMRMAQKRVTRA